MGTKGKCGQNKSFNIFKEKSNKTQFFQIWANEIEVVFVYVYLGTKFNHNGKFEVAMAKQKLKADKAKYSLLAKGSDTSALVWFRNLGFFKSQTTTGDVKSHIEKIPKIAQNNPKMHAHW